MEPSWIDFIPVHYYPQVIAGLFSMIITIVGYGLAMGLKAGKKAKKQIETIEAKVDLALENHFPHFQKSLDHIAEKQDQTNLELAEQTGVLKTIASILEKK